MSINPFRNHETATETDPRTESKAQVDEIVAERRERVAALVAEAEKLVESARNIIAADADVGRSYAVHVINPWRDDIMAAFQAFRAEVIGNRQALREATRLVRDRESAIAVEKFGPILARIRDLERVLGDLKRARPVGLSRIGSHLVTQVRPRPSPQAERLADILLEGAPQSDFGLVTVDDVISRLQIEEDPTDFILHRGTFTEFVWNAQVIVAEMEKQGVPA